MADTSTPSVNTSSSTPTDTTSSCSAHHDTTDCRVCMVAMDSSEHADYALEWFIENIHRPGDHVILVYVPELNDILHSTKWTTSAVYQFDRDLMDAMLKEEHARIKADLDKFAEKLRHHGLGGKVKSVMACKPGEGIIKAAEDEHAHLIVTGSRGLGQIRRTFMGSVSDYVVHHSTIPVFVCKHPHKHIPGHDEFQHHHQQQKASGDSTATTTATVAGAATSATTTTSDTSALLDKTETTE